MSTSVLGTATATTMIPLLGEAAAGIAGAVGLTLPDLLANVAIMTQLGVSLGLELPAVEAQFLTAAAASLAIQPPSISAGISANIGASMQVSISQLQAFAALAAYINGLRGQITATAYNGTVRGFVNESSLAVPGNPNDTAFSVTLSATSNVGIATLKTIFGIT